MSRRHAWMNGASRAHTLIKYLVHESNAERNEQSRHRCISIGPSSPASGAYFIMSALLYTNKIAHVIVLGWSPALFTQRVGWYCVVPRVASLRSCRICDFLGIARLMSSNQKDSDFQSEQDLP
jgi:hypothetical protein